MKRQGRRQPPAKRELRVAIIVDPMGHGMGEFTDEDEILEHKARLRKLLGRSCRMAFTEPKCVMDDMAADLVVFDFGGMMPGNSLMEDNSRRLILWAQDHPSSLVTVASAFTYRHGLLPELRELGFRIQGAFDDPPDIYERPISETLPNVVVFGSYEDDDQMEAIKKWFT